MGLMDSFLYGPPNSEMEQFFQHNKGKLVQITRISDRPPEYEYMAVGTVVDATPHYVILLGRERRRGGNVVLFQEQMELGGNDRRFRVPYSKIGTAKVLDAEEHERLQRAHKLLHHDG